MASRRVVRVGEQIRQEIARLLLFEAKDPILSSVTITGTQMTPDLRMARIYYIPTTNEIPLEKITLALSRAKGFLRRELGKRMSLRHTPALEFHHDRTLIYGRNMDKVLNNLTDPPQTEAGLKEEESEE